MAEQTPYATPDEEDFIGGDPYVAHLISLNTGLSPYAAPEASPPAIVTGGRYSRVFAEFLLLDEVQRFITKEAHKLADGARKHPTAIGFVAVGGVGLATGMGVRRRFSRPRQSR